jgi:cell wall-associated NlpC family hydrolase
MRRTNQVVERVRELKGVPYKHLGRDHKAIDCIGLLLHALDLREEDVPEFKQAADFGATYLAASKWVYRKEDPLAIKGCELLQAALSKYLLRVPLTAVRAGDVLLMRFKSRDLGDHVGIYMGEGKFAHADIRRGVVIDDEVDARIVKRIVAVYRVEHGRPVRQ